MARVRVLSDEELAEDLRKKFEQCDKQMNRLKIEFDLANEMYQGVQSNWREGAIDTALLAQLFVKRPSDDEIRLDSTVLVHAALFLHSKLCISEPQVVMRALNADMKNHKAAQSAQLIVEHIKNTTRMEEEFQRGPYLNTVVKGNGIVFVGWDKDAGELEANSIGKEFNVLEDEIQMTGDYIIRNVRPDCFYIDPTCTELYKANYVFEIEFRQLNALLMDATLDYEDITYIKEEMNSEESLTMLRKFVDDTVTADNNTLVPIIHYWEPHRAWNGMLGSHIVFMTPKKPKILSRDSNKYEHGKVPFAMLSDIDIPDSAYGMSRILLGLPLMEAISQMFSQVIANTELHGNIKLLMPEGALNDEATTNNPYDVLTYNAATGAEPKQLTPTHVTTDIWRFETIARKEIARIFGMSEFSQGEIPRELSSYAVQIAIEMDDKFRVRLFNKKKEFIKNVYEMLLSVTKQYVKTKRMLKIVGGSKISDNVFFDSADLEGEYGITADYGMYLPVDPGARKQQIIELVKSNVLQDAGIDMKKILTMLVSGDINEVKDLVERAKNIQDAENLDLVSGIEVPVQEWHDHEGHLASLADFMSDMFFEKLPIEVKVRVNEHKKTHEEEFAKLKAAAQGAPEGGGISPDLGAPPKSPATGLENMTEAPVI